MLELARSTALRPRHHRRARQTRGFCHLPAAAARPRGESPCCEARSRAVPAPVAVGKRCCLGMEQESSLGDAALLHPEVAKGVCRAGRDKILLLPAAWGRHGGVVAAWVAGGHHHLRKPLQSLVRFVPSGQLEVDVSEDSRSKSFLFFSVLLNHPSARGKDGAGVPSAAEGRVAKKGTGSSAFP